MNTTRLPFAEPTRPEINGELVLFNNGTICLVASAALREETERFLRRVDRQTVSWGSSLIIGAGAVGEGFRWHDRKRIARFFFALGFLLGVGSAILRFATRAVEKSYFSAHPVDKVRLKIEANSDLNLTINGAGLGKFVVTLPVSNLNPGAARAFVDSVEAARARR